MRTIQFILCFLPFFAGAQSDSLVNYLGAPDSIEFDGNQYFLQWSFKEGDYIMQEYVQEGDSVVEFDKMISLLFLKTDVKVADAVFLKAMELEEFKKTDPVCNYIIDTNPDETEQIIDFLRGESENNRMTIVEFNAHRYTQIVLPDGSKALLTFTYAERAYHGAIKPFLTALKEERVRLVEELSRLDMPAVEMK